MGPRAVGLGCEHLLPVPLVPTEELPAVLLREELSGGVDIALVPYYVALRKRVERELWIKEALNLERDLGEHQARAECHGDARLPHRRVVACVTRKHQRECTRREQCPHRDGIELRAHTAAFAPHRAAEIRSYLIECYVNLV